MGGGGLRSHVGAHAGNRLREHLPHQHVPATRSGPGPGYVPRMVLDRTAGERSPVSSAFTGDVPACPPQPARKGESRAAGAAPNVHSQASVGWRSGAGKLRHRRLARLVTIDDLMPLVSTTGITVEQQLALSHPYVLADDARPPRRALEQPVAAHQVVLEVLLQNAKSPRSPAPGAPT